MLHLVPLLGAFAFAGAALAAPPADLDQSVAALMAQTATPGVAVGIVENGQASWAKGYGVTQLSKGRKVDAGTLFQIGSVSKAFTVAALAVLVEEGKIEWDDRVIDHLPEFQMHDPWVTREITIRDLLVHRSGMGLGAGDLTFIPRTDITRAEVVRAVRHLKPQSSFRSTYAYDNLLYTVAGALIERVSGKSWEDFVRDRLLRPAGMAVSTTDEATRYTISNRAQPHARLGPPVRGVGDQTLLDERKGLSANSFPAGGITSSASEMNRWIALQLAKGQLRDGKRLWSEAASREMWSPVTPLPITPMPGKLAVTVPQFNGYALGWMVHDYRGARIVEHGGATLGFLAFVVMIPERDVGFVIVQNSEDREVMTALKFALLDHYLGAPATDWGKEFHAFFEAKKAAALKTIETTQTPGRVAPPSLALPRYAGRYVDPWYGSMTVGLAAEKLTIDFNRTPGMIGDLIPYSGDTFKAVWHDPAIEPAYVNFVTTPEGRIDHVLMKAASPLADFSYDYQDLDFKPIAK